MTLDDDQKYFIFGIKFDDIYIPIPDDEEISNKNAIKFFTYEKTYLFISNEPLCKLFEKIFHFILNYKKLNFNKNLADYSSLLSKENIVRFNEFNNETVRNLFINFN